MKSFSFPCSLPVLLFLLWSRSLVPAGPPELVKDINSGVAASSSSPSGFRQIGSRTVFGATDVIHGMELWATDGTAAGTELVKDIRPGNQGSNPALIGVMGGVVFFTAEEALSGRELWRTDGTAAGTAMVKDIHAGPAGANPNSAVMAGGVLYFFADYGATGYGLWKSDGTTAGTILVMNIWTGFSGAPLYQPANLTVVGSTLFFSGDGGFGGNELWKSDGTPGGTVQVKDIHPGTNGFGFPVMYNNSNPGTFCAVGNTLFFTANDGLNGNEVWKSDGTPEGTVLVKDIYPGNIDGVFSGVAVAALGGNFFFQAYDGTNGTRLWKSDGTAAGTGEVSSNGGEYPSSFCLLGGNLYFNAYHVDSGTELWRTDGTAAGTAVVRDIRPGTPGSNPSQLTAAGGVLYFTAENGTDGTELWKSDGTAAGTVQVKDIRAGSMGSQAASLAAAGSAVYFGADDGMSGSELWKSDGTPAGTLLVRDINQATAPSGPASLTTAGTKVYFSANDGTAGSELWVSDGTTAGTRLTKDIRPGTFGSLATTFYPAAVGSHLFFVANDGSSGLEVWKSDGTTPGTVQVRDIRAGSPGPNPQYLTGMGSTLFFTANDNVSGTELWKSDGTAAGTVMVKDLVSGSGGSTPDSLTPVNGTLFFVASDSANGRELWKSDGTPGGTVLVKDIRPGATGSNPAALTTAGSLLYFTANDGTNGTELWKSDGSAAGTVMVQNLSAGSSSTTLFSLTGGVNVLYFNVSSGSSQGLWKTDGTAAGTVLLKANPASWFVTSLTAAGNSLYFTYTNGTQSYELWKTDGTIAGTALVKDIRSGSGNPSMANLKTVGGSLYFTADNGADGAELWTSDGTGSGTAMVADLFAGPAGSDPAHLAAVGDRLLFSAVSGVAGRELWTYSPSSPELSGVAAGSDAVLSHLLISGFVNPGGAGTAVMVDYGPSPALGSTWYIGNFSGNTTQPFSATLYPGGLVPGTTYYYQVRASSQMGTTTAGPYPFSATAGSPEIQVETSQGAILPSTFPTVNLGAVDRSAPPRAINLTVRNTGDAPLTGVGASLSQNGFSYTITAPLPPDIAPGGSAVLGISYDAPVDCFNVMSITQGAQLTITSNDADESNYAIYFSAEPVQPKIQLRVNGQFISPPGPAWHFPRTRIGTPVTAVITVQNMGTSPLITTAPVALAGDNAFTVAGPDDFTLAPSAEVNYTLTFTPGGAGPAFGMLGFSTNDPCTFGTLSASFDGTGNAMPDAPDISVMTVEDTGFPGTSFSLNITDPDQDPLLLEILTLPARGILQGLPGPMAVLQIGAVSYIPAPNFDGTETFTYRVSDGYGYSRTATATITVVPVNDPPSANPQTLATIEDTPLPITLSATDIDSTVFTFAITQHPLHGTLSGTGAAVTYTPHPDYHGQDGFSFTASDGTAPVSSPAAVSITVTPDNGTPDISIETPAGLVLHNNSAYSLGNVERRAPPLATTFTVRNTGAETLTDVAAALAPSSPFATGLWAVPVPPPSTIPPGGTAELVVTYDAPEDPSPTGAALPDAAMLQITSNDADESPYRLSLSALPVKPEIMVEINGVVASSSPPPSFDFGRFILPRSQTISVRILNQGSSPLQTTSLVDLGNHPGFTITGPDTFSLAPGEAAAFVVTFHPPAPGTYFAFFPVRTNDSDEPEVLLTFHGRGNAPPVASDTVRELDEDDSWVVSFPSDLAADADGDYWSFHLMSAPAHGEVVLAGGTHTYVPETNWSGTDTFTFRVFDGLEYSAVKTAVIHVAAVNDPPLAVAQSISLPENGALGMVLEAQDVDNTAFTFAITQPPAHGTLTGTGPVRTYTPAPGYHGPDQFTFEASDGAASSIAVVSITVIQNLPEIQLEHPAGTVLTHGAVLDLGDVERLAPALAATITVRNTGTAPLSGLAAVLNQPGSVYQITGTLPASIPPGGSAPLVVAFDPLPVPHPGGGRTPHSATVEVSSNDADEASLTVHFTAVPVQPDLRLFLDGLPVEVPVTQDFGRRPNQSTGTAVLTLRNEGSSTLVSAAPSGPVPAAGFALTGPGGFSLAPAQEASWQISFSPATAAPWQSTVTFATNGVEGNLTVNLRGRGNTPPVAAAAAASCEEDTPWPGTSFSLSGTDTDGDALTWTMVSPPAHVFLEGLPAAGAPGEVFPAFLPDPDFHGTDTFTYRVSDGVEFSPPATVTLTVTPVNDPPAALAQSLTTPENTPLPLTLTAVDVDDAVLSYAIVVPPAHGALTGTGPHFTYTPAPNYFGPDSFVFRVADGAGSSPPAAENSITIDVISDGIDPAELDVEHPAGTPMANGGSILLGTSPVGGSQPYSLLLKNTGTGPLTGVLPQISGPQEADFTLTGSPAFPLAAGASTPLMITWTPGGTGLRKATLLILTNDSDESPYQIDLEGLATGPGLLDSSFVTAFPASGGISAMAEQPDGSLILGGYFAALAGSAGPNLVKLQADGAVDASFTGTVDDNVSTVSVLGDGKLLVGGFFSQVNGVPRPYLARLEPDGALDVSFAPEFNNYINCVAVRPDGRVLVGGAFTAVNGQARSRLVRLLADGSVDPAFQPDPDGEVHSLMLLGDGRIYAGGSFGGIGGVSRNLVARLLEDGTADPSFTPDLTGGWISGFVVQADHGVVIGGQLGSVDGLGRGFFSRLLANGRLDPGFSGITPANRQVNCLVGQADGKTLLAGPFFEVGSQWRHGSARLNANGTLDPTFNPDTWLGAESCLVLRSGRVLLAGDFTTVGGLPANRIARLVNDPAAESLTVIGADEVRWLRGGSAPETTQVSFEVSLDGQNTWTALGHGVRIAGGWRMAGGVLPVGGHVRARARIHGGLYGGSSGLVESVTSFGVAPVPEMTVEAPAGSAVEDGGTLAFGTAPSAGEVVRTVRIRNTGPAPLSGLQLILDGPQAAEFSITSLSSVTLTGGAADLLTVRFTPLTAGIKTAVLHILSNDEDEPSFDLTLTGQALAPVITAVSEDEEIFEADGVVLSVAVTGSAPFSYQWYAGAAGVTTHPAGTDAPDFATGPLMESAGFWVRVLNSFGQTDTPSISVNVRPRIPVFTSPPVLTGRAGEFFSTEVQATHGPLSFSSPDLPEWLVLDPATGELSGLPGAAGTWSFHITALTTGAVISRSATVRHELTVTPPRPVVTSADTAQARRNIPFAYQITAIPAPDGYAAAPLPAGLVINAQTGAISGTPGVAGVFNITLSAANAGGTGQQVLQLVIEPPLPPPAMVTPAFASASANLPFTFELSATAQPQAFEIDGHPAWLALDAGSGLLSGTPPAPGSAVFRIRAVNESGPGAWLTMTVAIAPHPDAPAITSATETRTRVGDAFEFQLEAAPPADHFTLNGPLPAGITFDTTSGLLTGTSSTVGTITMGVVGSNGFGPGQTRPLTIVTGPKRQVPVISSSASLSAGLGIAFATTVQASFAPSLFEFTGLPAGLVQSGTSGQLTGIFATPGIYPFSVRASNADGFGPAQLFHLTVGYAAGAPAIRLAGGGTTGYVGIPFSYAVPVSPSASSFTASGLPEGLTAGNSGFIAGTPLRQGVFSVMLQGRNSAGLGEPREWVITILPTPDTPEITGSLLEETEALKPFAYQIQTRSQLPISGYVVTGLPPGITYSQSTGIISGAAQVTGSFPVGLRASNQAGIGAEKRLTLVVRPGILVPRVTSTPSLIGRQGAPLSYQITATNPPLRAYEAAGLPPGLSLNATTGLITGQVHTPGLHPVTLRAGNVNGASDPMVLQIRINPLPAVPVMQIPGWVLIYSGQPLNLQLRATNLPETTPWPAGVGIFSDNLPAGMGLSPAGILSGFPNQGEGFKTWRISFYAVNETGRGPAFWSVIEARKLTEARPVINGPKQLAMEQGKILTFRISATGAPGRYEFGVAGGGYSYAYNGTSANVSVSLGYIPGSYLYYLGAYSAQWGLLSGLPLQVSPAAGAPVIQTPATNFATAGTALNFQLSASNSPYPYGYEITDVSPAWPSGLNFSATGQFTGTVTRSGVFSFQARARNAAGYSLPKEISLYFQAPPGAPVLGGSSGGALKSGSGLRAAALGAETLPAVLEARVGEEFSYQFHASGSVLRYVVEGLPEGIVFNENTGGLGGQPLRPGTAVLKVTAVGSETTSEPATIRLVTVAAAGTPAITSAPELNVVAGSPFNWTVAADRGATGFNLENPPDWLEFDAFTGVMTGTPPAPGQEKIVLSAFNPVGEGPAQTFTLTISAAPGTLTVNPPGTALAGRVGEPFTASLTAPGTPDFFDASALPFGISLNAATGALSGIPVESGVFEATVWAVNSAGLGTPVPVSFSILPAAGTPVITSAAVLNVPAGTPFTHAFTASPAATSFTVEGLPSGWNFNPATGVLSATPQEGTYQLSVEAWSPAGSSGQQPFQVTAAPAANSAELWRQDQFGADAGNPAVAGWESDPDRDGINNLVEMAFNLPPRNATIPEMSVDQVTGLPRLLPAVPGQDRLRLQFLRRKASTNPGITYRPQFCADLTNTGDGGWQDANGTPVVTSLNASWELVTIEDTHPARRRFARVVISQP